LPIQPDDDDIVKPVGKISGFKDKVVKFFKSAKDEVVKVAQEGLKFFKGVTDEGKVKKVVDADDKVKVKIDDHDKVVKIDHGTKVGDLSFGQLGLMYNQMTKDLIGGLTNGTQNKVLNEINKIQTGITNLIENGTIGKLGDVAVVHAQNVADQMNFLRDQVKAFGTNSYNPKFINDVVRDIQDIVNGDAMLQKAAMVKDTQGFQQVSNLLVPPAPFADSPVQTQVLLKFVADSNDLATKAIALAGTDPNSAAVKALVQDIQTFSANADAYTTQQDLLFQARFNNEFATNGVQGTASREMIKGLQSGDASLVNAAAEVLQGNANDVRGNMLASGDTYVPPVNGGIPLDIKTVQVAGQVFNDAITKLIGGISPANQTSVVNDLKAVADGLTAAITNENLTGKALKDANKIIEMVTKDAAIVQNTTLPQQLSVTNKLLHDDALKIVNIVQHDAVLKNLSSAQDPGNPGFAALPQNHPTVFDSSKVVFDPHQAVQSHTTAHA